VRIPFGTSSYRSRSLPLSAQRMVNCYLEPAPPLAKTFAAVVQSYGIDALSTVGIGPIRGGIVLNDVPYVVSGTKLFRLNSLGVGTELGSIPGSAYVDMAGDETNVMLVTAGVGYYWNGSSLQAVADPDLPPIDWVEVLDGYFIVGETDSGRFYVSANRNPASWDALDFSTAEKYPDHNVGCVVNQGEAVIFGKESGEVFYDSGDADFPLSRTPNGNFEIGLMSRFGAAKADNGIYFIGHDGIVYWLSGYQPVRKSTHAVEQWIEACVDKDFYAMAWAEAGHKFFSLTSTDGTFVFDISADLWHERESFGVDRWRPLFVLRAFNQWIVGDYASNKLGTLSPGTFSEWGEVLRSSCASPAVSEDNRRINHTRLELVFESGVGLTSGQGSDPQVMLRWSDDGGRTWSNEKWRGLGAIGDFRHRSCWNRLGQARDRVYEYAISDPIRRTLILATTEYQAMGY
jgi:hypothetical protein